MAGGLVRADTLPLVFRALGAEPLPRGSRVRVKVAGIDLLTLDVHASVAARLEAGAPAEDEPAEADEAEAPAGPLTLAIEVQDEPVAADAAAAKA